MAGRSRWLRNGFKVLRELSAREVTRARCASPRSTGRSKHLHKVSPLPVALRHVRTKGKVCIPRELEEEEEEREGGRNHRGALRSRGVYGRRRDKALGEGKRECKEDTWVRAATQGRGNHHRFSQGFASLVVASLDDARTHARIVFHRVRLQLVALARSLYTRVSSSYSSPVPPPPPLTVAISRSTLFSTLTSFARSSKIQEQANERGRTWRDHGRTGEWRHRIRWVDTYESPESHERVS